MKRIVVDMQNKLFSDALSEKLKSFSSDFEVYISECPEQTSILCQDAQANVLLMEITAVHPWTLSERLHLIADCRQIIPELRSALIVDENTDRKLAARVRQARKDNLIDSFFYGSVSSDYLSAVIDTL